MIDGLPGSCAIPDLPDVFCRFGRWFWFWFGCFAGLDWSVDNFRLNLLFVFSWLFDLVGFLKLSVDVCEDGGL
ncbi:hypothetical protein [Ensifer sp. LC163]|uniref:hypothetical protein n=1 Tax=Ensifer sp. LC163 TaxID=1120652 RepID=UPI001111F69B|nr:hypothetical protein [Ensifer sp. LC163]